MFLPTNINFYLFLIFYYLIFAVWVDYSYLSSLPLSIINHTLIYYVRSSDNFYPVFLLAYTLLRFLSTLISHILLTFSLLLSSRNTRLNHLISIYFLSFSQLCMLRLNFILHIFILSELVTPHIHFIILISKIFIYISSP